MYVEQDLYSSWSAVWETPGICQTSNRWIPCSWGEWSIRDSHEQDQQAQLECTYSNFTDWQFDNLQIKSHQQMDKFKKSFASYQKLLCAYPDN